MNGFLVFDIYLVIAMFFFCMAYIENEKAKETRKRILREASIRRAFLEQEKFRRDAERMQRSFEEQRRAYAAAMARHTPAKPWWCEALGIQANATVDQISNAYKTLAKSAHPDRGGSDDAMKRLNVARSAAMKERARA